MNMVEVALNQPLNKPVSTTAKMISVSVRPARDFIRAIQAKRSAGGP